jgi:imidazolonepropionase-like amidohydrolase
MGCGPTTEMGGFQMTRKVFTNVNLLDGANPAKPGMQVVVEGHRITSVDATRTEARPDDRIIDLAGKTMLPGLGTGHLHAEFHHIEMATLNQIYGGAERPVGVLMAVAINTCRNLLESGYTMAVSAACSNDIDACLKMGIDEGLFPGPRLQGCSPHLETTGNARPHWWYDIRNTGMQVFVDGPDEFRRAVRTQVSRGADWLKILPTGGHGITDPHNRRISTDEIKAVVQTAHEMGKRVRAHAAWRELIHECVEAGVDLIDHGDEIDAEIIDMMVERGTYWVPSMRVLDVALGISAGGSVPMGGLDAELTKGVRAEWDNLAKWLPVANEAGVKILTGDDYGVPIVPHVLGIYSTELTTYVNQIGIKPLDTLRWATRNVADLLGMAGELGTISAGALADLIVLRDDPSNDITLLEDPAANVLAVMKDGEFFKNALQPA